MSDNSYKDEALSNKDQSCAEQTSWERPTQEAMRGHHKIMLYIRERIAEEPGVRFFQVHWGEYLKIQRYKIDKEVVFWSKGEHLEFMQTQQLSRGWHEGHWYCLDLKISSALFLLLIFLS